MSEATTPTPQPAPPKPPNNWVGVGLLACWLALGGVILAAPEGILSGLAVFAFVMLGWILAVMAHEFAHAAVWEYRGAGQAPLRHQEPLTFENVHLAQRSYK